MKTSDKIGFSVGGVLVALLVIFLYANCAISNAEHRARLAESARDNALDELRNVQKLVDGNKRKQDDVVSGAKRDLRRAESIMAEVREALAEIKAPPEVATNLARAEDSYERIKIIEDLGLRHFPTDQRLQSGQTLVDKIKDFGGKGKLTLVNGLTEDAHVKIIHRGALAASFYVRGGEEHVYTTIPDGTFTVMYCTGYGWSDAIRDFKRGRSASKYDDELTYLTRQRREGNYITTTTDAMRLSLHKVLGGNATTSPLSLDEFDKY